MLAWLETISWERAFEFAQFTIDLTKSELERWVIHGVYP